MNNDITIDINELKNVPDDSITDAETIRQIALYSIKTGDKTLNSKIKSGYEVCGLYPHIVKSYVDIFPKVIGMRFYSSMEE